MNRIKNEAFQATSLIVAGVSDEVLRERLSRYYSKIWILLPYNTQRAYISDMNDFAAWNQRYSKSYLSFDALTNEQIVEKYFDSLMESPLALATVERRLATLSVFLEVCLWPNPMKTSKILKEHIRLGKQQKPAKQHQAAPLQFNFIDHLNDNYIPENALETRDRLIVNIMYDALLRGSEICNICVEHINQKNNTLFLPKSKRDQKGEGSYRFISDTSLELLNEWKNEYDIEDGFIIRTLSPKRTIQASGINYMSVYHTYKRIGKILGLTNVSTHSARVGAAVDMAENDIDMLSIQRAGGWLSIKMPQLYTEQVNVVKAGMGKLAAINGR
jgi:integrase